MIGATVDAPTNPRLVKAIVEVLDAPSFELDARLRPFLEALVEAKLMSGDDPFPSVVETDDEEEYLAVFTDLIELHFFEPGSPWRAISGEEALRRVARGDFDGLVVNPGQRQLELSRDDVQDFFEFDEK